MRAAHVKACAMPSAHLKKMANEMLQDVPSSARQGLKEMAKSCHDNWGGVVIVGSMFSGTEIGVDTFDVALQSLLVAGLCVSNLRIVHAFSCESSGFKRKWIRHFFKPKMLFGDASQLGKDFATCVIADGPKRVPRVDVFMAGFMCVDFSTMSSKHGKYVSSINKYEGKSAQTFKYAVHYMKRHKPALGFLENVGGIADDGQPIRIALQVVLSVPRFGSLFMFCSALQSLIAVAIDDQCQLVNDFVYSCVVPAECSSCVHGSICVHKVVTSGECTLVSTAHALYCVGSFSSCVKGLTCDNPQVNIAVSWLHTKA